MLCSMRFQYSAEHSDGVSPDSPDWAALVEHGGQERLYFVVETKSSLFAEDLRDREGGKIECARAHFSALAVGENPAIYEKFKDVEGLLTYEAKR